jgi:cyclohexanone monooxygenase
MPRIPGISSFAGKMFHTSHWDYDYTGGDTMGGLHKLADKRVAVIGTGATAVQVVPHVGKTAKHLYVFQRTPSSVDVRNNHQTDPDWVADLKPGWQRERQANFNAIVSGEAAEVDLVNDMWTDMVKYRRRDVDPTQTPEQAARENELIDMHKMHELRERVSSVVADETTAEALKAWYARLCKRPTFHDEYLPTFNRPNVTLVDTSAHHGVERITPKGVVVDGQEYEVDCIIWATGFEIASGIERRLAIKIVGENGVAIADHWAEDVATLHGNSTHGFPNYFFMGAGQSGLAANYTSVLDGQSQQIAYVIAETLARGAVKVQPSLKAQTEWVRHIRSMGAPGVAALLACTPGYYNNEGQIGEGKGRGLTDFYALGLNAFNRLLQQWRDEGSMQGLELDTADTDTPSASALA